VLDCTAELKGGTLVTLEACGSLCARCFLTKSQHSALHKEALPSQYVRHSMYQNVIIKAYIFGPGVAESVFRVPPRNLVNGIFAFYARTWQWSHN
jgi:hypothetical protein